MSVKQIFTLDTRTLAIFRIGVSLISVGQLVNLFPYIGTFFGVHGLVPCMWSRNYNWTYSVSLYMYICDNAIVFYIVYFTHIITGLAVLSGFGGWKVRILFWYLQMSFYERASPILNGGDTLLTLMVWWMMWLPVDRHYTLGKHAIKEEITECSWATVGFVLQICHVYFWNGYHKHGPAWRYPYYALYNALSDQSLATHTGFYVVRHALFFTRILTWLTLKIEMLFPLAVMWPFTRWTLDYESGRINVYILLRNAVIFTMMGFHLGILLCIRVGIFAYVPMCALIAMLPHETVCYFVDRIYKRRHHVVIIGGKPPKRKLHRKFKGTSVSQLLACFFTIYIFTYNLKEVGSAVEWISVPEFAIPLAKILNIDQRWSMFAPDVFSFAKWHVISGKLRNGTVIDVMRDIPLSIKKNYYVMDAYPTYHHRRIMRELTTFQSMVIEKQYLSLRFAKHWCHERNTKYGDLLSVKIWMYKYRIRNPENITRSVYSNEIFCTQ